MQIYYGTELTSNNVAPFSGTTGGRICDNRGYTLTYTIFKEVVTLYYHTDGSGSGTRGLHVTFTAIGNYCNRIVELTVELSAMIVTSNSLILSLSSLSLSLSLSLSFSLCPSLSLDRNECLSVTCHECNNLPGGYECVCRDGYYHSAAAATCYGESHLPFYYCRVILLFPCLIRC